MTHRPSLRPLLLSAIASLALGTAPASAQHTTEADDHTTHSQIRQTAEVHDDERLAQDWGLSTEEWARYRELMQGPIGVYSPDLDPLTALGIEARSDEERRRYAELQVQAEARRVEKLLSYQRAYDAAWQRLHPDMPRVELPSAALATPDAGAQRAAVFVRDACTACDQLVQRLHADRTEIDIYMVGSRQDDAHIRHWASRVGIDPARVRTGTITLNHDGGRWLSLGLPGELPAVVHEVDGQWQRQ
ncbi:TIGR03759 family integrating conjugative element protein [Billgrantia endophytica]|uniref:TIGR03759 family integrating conjugative element protein n=1 Tax=Billgrantia endophytica TaxID=2033802 RepID=A0A2N7UEG3_9GAMM|nr:TIGR03759 family integrating conjugative element protein [Halomonas endophytica]